MNIIENIEREQLRDDIPQFKAGDTVKVHFKVVEGTRHRIQVFQGIVIKRQGEGVRERFTVEFARGHLPDAQKMIRATCGRPFPVGAESDAVNCVQMHERWDQESDLVREQRRHTKKP